MLVWVLSPSVHTGDANLDYYYDDAQSKEEYTKVFKELGLDWRWQPVTMQDHELVIQTIANDADHTAIVLNLCDGDEMNGAPGISVIRRLKEHDLIFTGADAFFYTITTSKIDMKQAFDAAGVATPAWQQIEKDGTDIDEVFRRLGRPLILKPAISAGSMGVGIRSVVETKEAFAIQLNALYEGYRGWDLASGGVIAEAFIAGPEFTTFISGSYDDPEHCHIYPPVERVFHPSLPEKERFLSFDRLWEIYEDESSMPEEADFYQYQRPDPSLIDRISKISWDAYCATKGKGYTRVDIRMDQRSGRLYVLEVNAQCGLSEDENYTSIGAILRLSGNTFTMLVKEVLQDACLRCGKPFNFLS